MRKVVWIIWLDPPMQFIMQALAKDRDIVERMPQNGKNESIVLFIKNTLKSKRGKSWKLNYVSDEIFFLKWQQCAFHACKIMQKPQY